MEQFIKQNFNLVSTTTPVFTDSNDIDTHIRKLWTILCREANLPVHPSTLIPLDHAYIVPGGRFREIYYWDSYFTQVSEVE